jgi:hypothetical protein
MGTGPFRRRQESRAQAEAKLALARAMIEEADRRWHGMAAFLERSGRAKRCCPGAGQANMRQS